MIHIRTVSSVSTYHLSLSYKHATASFLYQTYQLYHERMEEEFSTGEAAKRLGISFITLKRWIYAGKLKARRTPAGRWRILQSEIDRFLREMPRGPAKPQPPPKPKEAPKTPPTPQGPSEKEVPKTIQEPVPRPAQFGISTQALLKQVMPVATIVQRITYSDMMAAASKLVVFTPEKLAESAGVSVEAAKEFCERLAGKRIFEMDGAKYKLVVRLI